jgi:transcriptional regulator with XRE-family HTH domain
MHKIEQYSLQKRQVEELVDTVLEQVGPRLRAARLKQGLTLAELATRAGLSASTLSRLESGKRQANLELLLPLTRELRIGFDQLIPASVPDPRVHQKSVRRDGVLITALSPTSSSIRTFKMVYPPLERAPEQRVHDGYDWIYVISGRLRLRLAEHDLGLEPGEAAEFDTRVPHSMNGVGTGPTEVLCIFNEDGARIHTRAQSVEVEPS